MPTSSLTKASLRAYHGDNHEAEVWNAIWVSPLQMKLMVTFKDHKTLTWRGLDFSHAKQDIIYKTDSLYGALCNRVQYYTQGWGWFLRNIPHMRASHTFNRPSLRSEPGGGFLKILEAEKNQFPYFYFRHESQPAGDVNVKTSADYYAPAPETALEFQERMTPFLHEAAVAFAKQAAPHMHVGHLTGKSRDMLGSVASNSSNARAESSAHIGDIPIGFCMKDLQSHVDGTPCIEDRDKLEVIIRNIHAYWTGNDEAWWRHHLDHDHVAWNKDLSLHRVLYENPDGDIETIFDIRDFIETNTAGTPTPEFIKAESEKIFHKIGTKWFEKAIYTEKRVHITHRELKYQQK